MKISSEIALICSELVHLLSHGITLIVMREAGSKSSCQLTNEESRAQDW